MKQHCKKCQSDRKVNTFHNSSFFSALLIVVIPKCPFCIMAYSSAITICGGQDIYMASNNWVSFIPLALAVMVLFMIGLNYRGARTWVAMSLATISTVMIMLSHQLVIPSAFYEVGAIALLLSIWINGNLLSFVNYFKRFQRSQMQEFPAIKSQVTNSINHK